MKIQKIQPLFTSLRIHLGLFLGGDRFYGRDIRADLHKRSRKYWTDVSSSYLGTSEYYEKQEISLRQLLSKNGPFKSVLDLGCADGRYSLVAAEHAEDVLGVDLNPLLIEQAQNRALADKHTNANIEFRVEAVDAYPKLGTYSLVMCMGVTSCLISLEAFENLIKLVRRCVQPGGLVFLKDTLSRDEPILNQSGQYIAIYRNRNDYLTAWSQIGLQLEEELALSETETTSNALMVFRVA